MKFIIHGGTLSRYLSSIMGLVGKNNTIPIVENLLFELNGNSLSITSTDLETVANVNIELQDAEDIGINKVCIPGKELYTLVSQLTAYPLTVFVNEDYSIDIKTDSGGQYVFKGLNAEDFPRMTEIEDKVEATIKSSILVNAISKTIFATANEEFRPQLSGVLCEFSPLGLTFVGTDSHKLVRFRRTDYATSEERSVILPKKSLSMISKILASINEDLDVKIENNLSNIAFYFKNYHFSCRLIDGKYPNYEAAIVNAMPNPADSSVKANTILVSRNQLLDCVKRVSIFCNKANDQIRFCIYPKKIIIRAEDMDTQNNAQEEVVCDYDGSEMIIGLTAKYLVEVLSNIETETVKFEVSSPNKPCVVKPYEEESSDNVVKDDILMLIMPVILV